MKGNFKEMKKALTKRLIAGCSAAAFLFGMNTSEIQMISESVIYAEAEGSAAVESSTTRFNLNGGSLENANYDVLDGLCTLREGITSADAPSPIPPKNSNLVFDGWRDSSGNITEEFEADKTYFANWKYGTAEETNSVSNLKYMIYTGDNFFDLRGNNGSFKTTYSFNGYQLIVKQNGAQQVFKSGNARIATGSFANNIFVTPVISFCNNKGEISEYEENNGFFKIDYLIQNRGDASVSGISISTHCDTQIGGNDHAVIYGYAPDNTRLTPDNKDEYSSIKGVEMHDGSGNIYSLNLSEGGDCWWGHYGSRTTYAFSGHTLSDYNTGYDSGIAFCWNDITVDPGQTVKKTVIFSAGDIHFFRSHNFNEYGICASADGCDLAMDHSEENQYFVQPATKASASTYEVYNAGQLMWISDMINNGTLSKDTVVNIMHDIVFPEDFSSKWTPIKEYSGQFNGNGFSISGINFAASEEPGGIFGTLNGAGVYNLGIKDSSFSGESAAVGALAASAVNSSNIKNIFCLADISGSKAAGLVYSVDKSKITASYFAGNTDNHNFIAAEVTGNGTVEKTYFLDPKTEELSGVVGTGLSSEEFRNGCAAYKLGSPWTQNLGSDPLPVLNGTYIVYKYTENHSCSPSNPSPETIYTNDASMNGKTITVEHHIVRGGIAKYPTCTENAYAYQKCENCEYVSPELIELTDEEYLATGHNHGDDGYCTNINPNTNTKCNHFDPDSVIPVEVEEGMPQIVGELTARPMTYDEIVSEGIDVSAPENNNIVKYTVDMGFDDEIVSFSVVRNKTTIIIPSVNGTKVERDKPVYVASIKATVTYTIVDNQEMFIIVYGECKWLKEFYKVQLLVMNSGEGTLKDCSATLYAPDGLTLCNYDKTQNVGDLTSGAAKTIDWIVRGDKAGDYSLRATFQGHKGDDVLTYEFTTKDDIHVYGSEQLKMTVEAPRYSTYGEPYEFKIIMTNISDKPIYKFENTIKNVEHGYYTYERKNQNGHVVTFRDKTTLSSGGKAVVKTDQLDPGDSAVIVITVKDLWKSPIEKWIDNVSVRNNILLYRSVRIWSGADFIYNSVSYYLTDIEVKHILNHITVTQFSGSSGTIPCDFVITDNKSSGLSARRFYPVLSLNRASEELKTPVHMAVLNGTKQENINHRKDEYVSSQLASAYAAAVAAAAGCVQSVITAGTSRAYVLRVPSNITSRVYITNSDGQIINPVRFSSGTAKATAHGLTLSDSISPFTLTAESGETTYEDGIFTASGNAIFSLSADVPGESAVIHVEYSDGETAEYPVMSVEEHTCTGGKYYLISGCEGDEYGCAIQTCSICGEITDAKSFDSRSTAMLDNGMFFSTVYGAAEYAKTHDGNYELSCFGNIVINEDLVIPENVKFIITPFANITFKNNAKIITDDTTENLSESEINFYNEIICSTYDNNYIKVYKKLGDQVTAADLPVLCTECGFDGWYSDPECTIPFEEFTVGDGTHSMIYYSKTEHSFGANGSCSKCGEIRNGLDTFVSASLSSGKDLKLNFNVKLTDKALSYGNIYMVYTYADGSKATQNLRDAYNNGSNIYRFTCNISPDKMSEKVKAQLVYDKKCGGTVFEYSAENYLDKIIEHSDMFDVETINVMQALKNFGKYLSIYTSNSSDTEENIGEEMSDVVIPDEFKSVKNQNSTSVVLKSARFHLGSLAGLNFKFTADNISNYTCTIDGKEATPVRSGDVYTVSVDKIAPADFDKMFHLKLQSKTDENDYTELYFSCLSYAKAVIEGDFDTNTSNAMKAMYLYNQALKSYIASR